MSGLAGRDEAFSVVGRVRPRLTGPSLIFKWWRWLQASVWFCVVGYHSVINRTIAQTGITTSPHGYANYSGQISIQKILDQIKENEKPMLQYRRDSHKILSLYEEMRKTIDYRENLERENQRMGGGNKVIFLS